jgi:taspase (threonine aspartase 1)
VHFPSTLASVGARTFAAAHDPALVLVPEESQKSPKARDEWSKWKSRLSTPTQSHLGDATIDTDTDDERPMQDTVGAVVMSSEDSAAGVSSGGILLKIPGRVGEAAVFGAGCFAAKRTDPPELWRRIACSVSGTGEQIVRAALAKTLCESFIQSKDEDVDVHTLIETSLSPCINTQQHPSAIDAGVLLITQVADSTPRLWCAFTTDSMAVAYMSSNQTQPQVDILRKPARSSSRSTSAPIFITSFKL